VQGTEIETDVSERVGARESSSGVCDRSHFGEFFQALLSSHPKPFCKRSHKDGVKDEEKIAKENWH